MLINVSPGNLQVNLFSPNITANNKKMNRQGPTIALSLVKGISINILPYFDNSIEKAHAAMKHSRDSLNMLRPGMLHTYICDDNGKQIDVEALLGGKKPTLVVPPVPKGDVTKPVIDAEVKAKDADNVAAMTEAVGQAEENKMVDVSDEPSTNIPDKFIEINGVGEATEQKLRNAGYATFVDLATASIDDLSKLLDKRAANSIQKQAQKLVK